MVRAIRQQQPDAVFHLGDCERDTQRLEKEFPDLPLYRVCGNCDREPVNPEVLQLTLDGVKFFLTHGHRYSVKYALDALPVSYTHLDVYKRQVRIQCRAQIADVHIARRAGRETGAHLAVRDALLHVFKPLLIFHILCILRIDKP